RARPLRSRRWSTSSATSCDPIARITRATSSIVVPFRVHAPATYEGKERGGSSRVRRRSLRRRHPIPETEIGTIPRPAHPPVLSGDYASAIDAVMAEAEPTRLREVREPVGIAADLDPT